MEYLIAGAAYFVFVFFKAFQQRNVAFLHYKMILPVSYALAGTEVFVYALITFSVIKAGGLTTDLLWYVFAVGTGGGLGAMLGMKMHDMTTSAARRDKKVKFAGEEDWAAQNDKLERQGKHYNGVNTGGAGCRCSTCLEARARIEFELGD